MKLTIASLAVYVTLAFVIHQPDTTVGHVLDLPPDFLHDASSNLLEMESIAAMGKGRPGGGGGGMQLDGSRKSHHCSVEMKMRIPGKCKYMGRAGVACVAGEYMDLVNEECLM